MRTSVDVYNRIRWDEKHDPEHYMIGYRNFQRIVEIPLVNWSNVDSDGDIPWHRVEYFKNKDNMIMWHKTKRIDGIFNTGTTEPYLDTSNSLKSFANVKLKPLYQDQQKEWIAGEIYNINHQMSHPLSFITWNILSDEFQKDDGRFQRICDTIKGYDIICLQEVTKNFLQVLKRQDWINEYWISDHPDNPRTMSNDMCVFTMSKIPAVGLYMLQDTKNSLISEFIINGYSIKLANIHLTSDHHGDAKERRQGILNRIRYAMQDGNGSNGIGIVVGDFNCERSELNTIAPWLDRYESICEANTFCPSDNPLASAAKRQHDRQIDYIFITSDLNWHMLDTNLIKTHHSDHYGITAKIELFDGKTSSDSCIVAVPPLKYWPVLLGPQWIQKSCLSGSNNKLKSWVPHISVVLGYYAVNTDKYLESIEVVSEQFSPFLVEFPVQQLQKFGSAHPAKLKDDAPSALVTESKELRDLESHIRKTCPTATRHLHDGVYTPHITVIDSSQLTSILPMEWKIENLYVDVKQRGMFKHHDRIGPCSTLDVDQFVESLRKLFPLIKFQVIGSRYYLDDQDSDLDLIAYGLVSQEDFYDRTVWIGQNCGYFEHTYITDSKIRIVKMFNPVIGHVDLQYIQCTEAQLHTCPSTWTVEYDELQLVDRSRILVLQDNIHYNNILDPEQKTLINQVKKWAKRRRIYLNCVGYLSGIVVTVMVVYSKAKTMDDFFRFYKDFDFTKNTISEKGFRPIRSHPIDKLMFVSSPIHSFNLNVKVTRSAIKWIRNALNDYPNNKDSVLEISDIEAPYLMIDSHELGIEENGRLTGRIVNLIVLLEKQYNIYVHVIDEKGKIYMFLHKPRLLKSSSKEIIEVIKDWFKRNDFNVKLTYGRN